VPKVFTISILKKNQKNYIRFVEDNEKILSSSKPLYHAYTYYIENQFKNMPKY
jgi:hypothetical protein